MRDRVQIYVAALFYYSGLVNLALWWRRRRGPALIILNYHRAAGGDLRSHLLYLRSHYRVLHLETALEMLYKKEYPRPDRRTLLALTFDDGYHDNYSHAFALVRELKVPITIFLVPGYIESGRPFWWLEGEWLVGRAQASEVTIEGRVYHLERVEDRKALIHDIGERVLYAASVDEREQFLESTRRSLAVPSSVLNDEKLSLPLTWAEVHRMEISQWVSFGAHTMHHPVLAYLSDPGELQFEVEECRAVLEQRLGRPVHSFAYPLGKPEHIGDAGQRAVRQADYKWAVTTVPGFNTPRSSPYMLRRRNVGVNQHWLVMAAGTAGVTWFFSRLLRVPRTLMREHLMNILRGGR